MIDAEGADTADQLDAHEERSRDAGTYRHLTPGTVDRQVVSRVIKAVELDAVRMRWCNAGLACSATEVPVQWSEHADLGLDSHLHGRLEGRFAAEAFMAVSWSREKLNSTEGGPPTQDRPEDLDILASFELVYRLDTDEDFDDESLEQFCVFNATFNAWPYFREFVQSMTQRLGITPFVLPVLRIPQITTGKQ